MSTVLNQQPRRSQYTPAGTKTAPAAVAKTTSVGATPSAGSTSDKRVETSHYAYVLMDNGSGQMEKQYVNQLKIYETEGKFGSYLACLVTGEEPLVLNPGKVYIAKRKPAA